MVKSGFVVKHILLLLFFVSDNGNVSVEGKFDNIETECHYTERFLSGCTGIGWRPVRTEC